MKVGIRKHANWTSEISRLRREIKRLRGGLIISINGRGDPLKRIKMLVISNLPRKTLIQVMEHRMG